MDFYKSEDTSLIQRVMSWIVDITVVLSFAWFCFYAFGVQIEVAGQSMTPLLNSGDVVLMNRLAYDLGKPQRLDVVVFQREDEKMNVKRIVGLPGDVIQIRNGFLYVDGERLVADNGLDQVTLAGLAENPIELGEDEYFLLGDNRDSSEDSRFANVGNVREDQILGKVWFRISPLIDIGWIRSH